MASNSRVVIDASIALKWFHQEKNTDEAVEIQKAINDGTITGIVPDLIYYETANVLVRGIGKKEDAIVEAMEILADMVWNVVPPDRVLLQSAIELALQHDKLSVYDAMYIALAVSRQAKLITADKKLFQIAGPQVALLL
ncbi:MAG: type II toxin-antitoxin system VapC family toxin [Candidatus Andersenbacteria bacterium]